MVIRKHFFGSPLAQFADYVHSKFPNIPDKSDGTDGPIPWEVRFNKACRTKKSNFVRMAKQAKLLKQVEQVDEAVKSNEDRD